MAFAIGRFLGWGLGTLWTMGVFRLTRVRHARAPTGRGTGSRPFGFAAYLKRGT